MNLYPNIHLRRNPFLCTCLAIALLATLPAYADESRPAPVIIEGRINSMSSYTENEERVTKYLVWVDEVRNGKPVGRWVFFSVGAQPPDDPNVQPGGRRAFQPGERLQMVLRPGDEGTYELLSSHTLGAPTLDIEPTGLSVSPTATKEPLFAPRITVSATPEEQVVELTNQERLANGSLPPYKHQSLLDTSSAAHSSSMATNNFVAHCDLVTMSSPGDRINAAGYITGSTSENIGVGYHSAASAVDGWMGSPGHKANILRTDRREIGVGYVNDPTDTNNVSQDLGPVDCIADTFNKGPYFHYWTQNFGKRDQVYPMVIDREAFKTTSTAVNLYVYGVGFATEMRFMNAGGAWSAWEPYATDRAWTLSSGNGTKTVDAEIRNAALTVKSASDTIYLESSCTPDHDLSNQTVSTTMSWEACNSIAAGSSFDIVSPGDVTFTAPFIILKNGFAVHGGIFRAVNGTL